LLIPFATAFRLSFGHRCLRSEHRQGQFEVVNKETVKKIELLNFIFRCSGSVVRQKCFSILSLDMSTQL